MVWAFCTITHHFVETNLGVKPRWNLSSDEGLNSSSQVLLAVNLLQQPPWPLNYLPTSPDYGMSHVCNEIIQGNCKHTPRTPHPTKKNTRPKGFAWKRLLAKVASGCVPAPCVGSQTFKNHQHPQSGPLLTSDISRGLITYLYRGEITPVNPFISPVYPFISGHL